MTEITVVYRAVDGFRKRKRFKTLKGAQAYAHRAIGEHPDIGGGYAVSFDGIATIRVAGVTLAELFPPPAVPVSTFFEGR